MFDETGAGYQAENLIGGLGNNYGAHDNQVALENGTIEHNVYGGYSTDGTVTANTVEISGGIVTESAYGGRSSGGAATNNTVRVSDGTITESVYGGSSQSNDVNGNMVEVSGSTATMLRVYGGHTYSGTAADNEVTISDGTITNNVYGGYTGDGDATGNRLKITGGTMNHITGGDSTNGSATGNTVDISGGSLQGVDGGNGTSTTANNTVIISGGTISHDVTGGSGEGVTNNTVRISGSADIGQKVYGGRSYSTDAVNNKVIISGGTMNNWVYGARSEGANASGNVVEISDGTVNTVFGGASQGSNATNNTVTISGGNITNHVYGGYSFTAGNATNNTVNISGGAIDQNVYGGAGSDLTTHNRVILSGAPIFGGGTVIGGGTDSTNVTGNILEIRTKGLSAGNIENFAQYHFLLPADTVAGETMLTLNDTGGTNISNTRVGVALQSGVQTLVVGDQVTLIHNGSSLDTTGLTQTDITAYQGISLEYAFDLSNDANNLYATAREVDIRDQTKAPVEGRVSTMAFTQQGADMIAGAAMHNMRIDDDGAFGVISGGNSRYNTGSHADVNGVNMMVGAKKHFSVGSGTLAAGAFIEGGWGNYDTYNRFDSGKVHGNGSTDYYGIGMLIRQDWDSGLYVEGSLHGGRISSDWSSSDMGVSDASYDLSTPYYGAHIGLGTVIPFTERTSVDLSAKYFWAHQGSESVTIAGDPYHFDSVDSQRTRLGARVNYAFNDRLTGYAGAAWEHEYDGVARATAYGQNTPSPSLKGDTGVFELGMNVKPDTEGPLSIEVGLQGYTGQREGFGGSLDMNWAF